MWIITKRMMHTNTYPELRTEVKEYWAAVSHCARIGHEATLIGSSCAYKKAFTKGNISVIHVNIHKTSLWQCWSKSKGHCWPRLRKTTWLILQTTWGIVMKRALKEKGCCKIKVSLKYVNMAVQNKYINKFH